uniref:Uncharacterized protein n=1 Tax=Picea glauca TaxID=3330 RepID=A0A101LUJ2_PICGL|nr:hypothetical protein ABT39_MTgene2445 [Picea glauca]QHR88514.1 hypothetical protein Q903MT_gene2528 [Picea sitchensis]
MDGGSEPTLLSPLSGLPIGRSGFFLQLCKSSDSPPFMLRDGWSSTIRVGGFCKSVRICIRRDSRNVTDVTLAGIEDRTLPKIRT